MYTHNTFIRITTPLVMASLLMAGCLGKESGIDQRHILGVVIIPPVEYAEIETGNASENDEVATAEDLALADPAIYVGYQYLLINGVLSEVGYVLNVGYNGDWDYYKLTSGFEGDITFDLEWTTAGGDYDLFLYDFAGNEVAAANASAAEGYEHLDYTISEEEELYLAVVGKSMPDGYDGSYRLIMQGLDPNEADDVILGAYVNNDVEDLGDPVSGTSVSEWNLDETTYRYWTTFDMYHVRQVEEVTDVFVRPELEDGIDNNCDGITDRGNEMIDRDGDGAMVSDGDCNDLDETIRPGFPDIAGNGRDDDCDGWADNGLDGVDDDGDGMSEFEGDCNDQDPEIYQTLMTEEELGLLEDGKDNNCDGQVDDDDTGDNSDSPEDNDNDGWTVDMGDCNDADPSVHPCADDAICLDYRDGKDNDCDANRSALSQDKFDENFEYYCPEGLCSPNQADNEFALIPAMDTDDDGDGYSENTGDCDDTLGDENGVYPGNYELRTEVLVNNDIEKVYIYGGTITSINTTTAASGDIVTCEPQEVILSALPGEIVWDLDEDWSTTGGQLVPDGVPEISLGCMMPPLFGVTCYEEEPNDYSNNASFPWEDATECDGIVSPDGYVDRYLGTFETIVPDSWDGDNDTYHFFTNQDGYVNAELDWETDSADLDFLFYCYFGNDFNPWNWYYMIPSDQTAYLSKPEGGQTVVPMEAGTECYIWASGYSGPSGEPYKLKLWMTPEEV